MTEDNSADSLTKRPQFGNRFLPKDVGDDDESVFKHNAW